MDTEKQGEEASNNKLSSDLKGLSSPSKWLCSSARPSQGKSLTKEIGGVQVCLIQVPEFRFAGPRAWSVHSQARG